MVRGPLEPEEGPNLAVYEGTLKALAGGAHQTNAFQASEDWVRLEFVAIGDQRIKDVRMLNLHYELLKLEIGNHVALSMFTGGFKGPRKDQWTLVAARLPDGTVEKIPAEYSRIPVQFSFQMLLVTLMLVGVAVAGLFFQLIPVTIGSGLLAAFIFYSLVRDRAKAAGMSGQIRGAMRAFDGAGAR